MGFKPVGTQALDIKTTPDKPYVGHYTGRRDITTSVGPQIIWTFTDEDDLPFGIYNFTNLGRIMETIKVGSLVRITYKGTAFVKTKFKPAGQSVHQVLVEVDSGDESAPTEEAPTPEE